MRTKLVAMTGLLTLLAFGSAYGQKGTLKATISFQFTAAGKAFPAGEYEFTVNPGGKSLKIAGANGAATQALVITRLARAMHTASQDAYLAFDKVGDTYFLSEIWFPREDGFLLHGTKGKHEHQIINAPQ